jgi:hypothetical protein
VEHCAGETRENGQCPTLGEDRRWQGTPRLTPGCFPEICHAASDFVGGAARACRSSLCPPGLSRWCRVCVRPGALSTCSMHSWLSSGPHDCVRTTGHGRPRWTRPDYCTPAPLPVVESCLGPSVSDHVSLRGGEGGGFSRGEGGSVAIATDCAGEPALARVGGPPCGGLATSLGGCLMYSREPARSRDPWELPRAPGIRCVNHALRSDS